MTIWRLRPLLSALVLLIGLAIAPLPTHANTPPPWTVSLDANSTSTTDVDIQATNNATNSFTVGGIINASSAQPVTGVYAWQFAITYDNTSITPSTTPVHFGSQSTAGHPDWSGLVTASKAFGSSSISAIDATHQKITTFFTLLGSIPPVSISPTVQGDLLANVNFTILPNSKSPLTLTITDTQFLDNAATTIPNINNGSPVTENLSYTPQPWTVSLDAKSTSTADTDIQATNNATNSFAVGAIIDASSAHPLIQVYGWQFAITYDNTSITPGTTPVHFGSQSTTGHPNWSGLITVGKADGFPSTVPVNNTHQKITIAFTLIGSNLPVSISPMTQGDLLANVNFTILHGSSTPLTLPITDVIFAYNNGTTIPNINPGQTITETVSNTATQSQNPLGMATPYIIIVPVLIILVLIALVVLLVMRRRKLSRKTLPSRETKGQKKSYQSKSQK